MMKQGGVVLVEFNELSPTLMEAFIKQGRLPNFRRFRSESQVYVTEAAERYPHLDPWIQWVTVHTGLDFADHGIEHLDQAHGFEGEFLWDILAREGHSLGLWGSMSVRCREPFEGFVLPDPWATTLAPRPAELEPYFSFIQRNVREHTNDKVPLTRLEYASIVGWMARHGLSRKTLTAVMRQLVTERSTGQFRWRRASVLDRMQWDVFRWYFRRYEPAFATFFSNSTAHYQHLYWRNMDPDSFSVRPSPTEQRNYGNAILYGYERMDDLLGEIVGTLGEDRTLIFVTALSQQPYTAFEESGGKRLYRPRSFETFAHLLGFPPSVRISPVMSHEFYVEAASESEAVAVERIARSMSLEGEKAMNVSRSGLRVQMGCRVWSSVARTATLRSEDGGIDIPFFDLFYQVEGMKSGMHHPDGILWIRRPDRRHDVHADRVPLGSVAPTILDMFALDKPKSMPWNALPGFGGIACVR